MMRQRKEEVGEYFIYQTVKCQGKRATRCSVAQVVTLQLLP